MMPRHAACLGRLACVTKPPDCQRARGRARADRGRHGPPALATGQGETPPLEEREGPFPAPGGAWGPIVVGPLRTAPRSEARLPLIWISTRVDHGEDDDLAVIDAIIDAERETRCQRASNSAMDDPMRFGPRLDLGENTVEDSSEPLAQSLPLLLVPARRAQDVGHGLGLEDHAYSPISTRRRAFTSSQEEPDRGSAS